jgi:hypothetical protein
MEGANPSPLVPDAHVDDEEVLYHAVRYEHFTRLSDTEILVSENAYWDAKKQPSVDRALLRENEPQQTRFHESDAIVSLVTKEVRTIDTIFQNTPKGKPTGDPYRFDVIWRPVQIETERQLTSGPFSRLMLRLADMSVVEIDPYEQVVFLSTTKRVYHRKTCRHLKSRKESIAFKKLPAHATACTRCLPVGWATE